MDFSQKGLGLLAAWEGEVLHIYKDACGLPTVGVGHLLTKAERDADAYKGGITQEQSREILKRDLKRFIAVVSDCVKVSLNQDQFDALVIFSFNIGDSGFRNSTLLKKLNSGDYESVPTELKKWNKAGGKICNGLIERRAKEVKLWQGGY